MVNLITDGGLTHLTGLTRLTELDLGMCSQITDQGRKHLDDLRHLYQQKLVRDFLNQYKLLNHGSLFPLDKHDNLHEIIVNYV